MACNAVVPVFYNDLDFALKKLSRKMEKEGCWTEINRATFAIKPSEKKRVKSAKARARRKSAAVKAARVYEKQIGRR